MPKFVATGRLAAVYLPLMHASAASRTLPMSGAPDAPGAPGASHDLTARAVQLVRQATGGDLAAFEELIKSLQRRVYGFAYQHLRDADEAHDLSQEIFVKLYRNLARYDPDRPFEPWFWKLAANTTINYRRKRAPMPLERDHESQEATHGDPTSPQHDPALVDALAQLDPIYRLPILLHYYADLSLRQVSQTLNLTIPTLKSRLHRARAQLRNALAESEESEESEGSEGSEDRS